MGKRKKVLLISGMMTVLLGMMFFATCTFKSPSTPIWSVQFVVPLIDTTYTMVDLADTKDNLDIRDHEVLFTIDKDIKTFEVGDQLKVGGVSKQITVSSGSTPRDSVAIPVDIVVVDTAKIKTGTMRVEIENRNNYPVQVHFEIEDLFTSDETTFKIDRNVPANSPSYVIDSPLAGNILIPPIRGGQNYIRFNAGMTGGGGKIRLTLNMSDLVFSSVTGVLNNVTVSIDSEETDVDIPEEFEGFQIGSAGLKLVLNTGILFPLHLNLSVDALESRETLPSPIVIDTLITPTGATADTIYIRNVADFINSLPTKILVSGSVKIGDVDTHATISDTNTVNGKAIFQAPLTFSLPSKTNESDVESLEQDEDARKTIKDIRKRFVSGGMIATVINHLPIGVDSVLICFAKDSTSVFTNPDLKIGLSMKSGTVSGTPGVVKEPATSENEVAITNEDLKLFEENEVIYYGTRFEFPGTQGMVKVMPSDSIRIQAVIKAKVRADFSKDDDEKGGGS